MARLLMLTRKLFCVACCLLLVVGVTKQALGRVAPTTLKELTLRADAIALAKVERIEQMSGRKLATATVLRPLKALEAGSRFRFLAEPTWACDSSTAVAGEVVLLFLARPLGSQFKAFFPGMPWTTDLKRPQRLNGMQFYLIAHAGRGRIPVEVRAGRNFLRAWRYGVDPVAASDLWINGVQMPTMLRDINPTRSGPDYPFLVSLQEVGETILRYLKINRPARPQGHTLA
jgi:hypothetical protein